MNTCKSCKHWRYDYVGQTLYNVDDVDDLETASCVMLGSYLTHNYDAIDFDSDFNIDTPANFYCAHHLERK
jgi:hypothetical protein